MDAEQAAAIAIRRKGNTLQVCLIRRRGTSNWGIPKGTIEVGDTAEETALNEAWEEAGLRGTLLGRSIGTYEYRKWNADLTVAVFLMQVLEQDSDWQEAHFRERCWTSLDEAAMMLADHPVRPLLDRAITRLGQTARRNGS
jgi:phosphohistidine phosphatase